MIKKVRVQNMKCSGCANTITKALAGIEGIKNTAVNLETHEVSFEIETEEQFDQVKQLLRQISYPVVE